MLFTLIFTFYQCVEKKVNGKAINSYKIFLTRGYDLKFKRFKLTFLMNSLKK